MKPNASNGEAEEKSCGNRLRRTETGLLISKSDWQFGIANPHRGEFSAPIFIGHLKFLFLIFEQVVRPFRISQFCSSI